MLSNWPQQDPVFQFPEECERMESLMEIVRSIRNLRAEMKVPPAQRISVRLNVPETLTGAYRAMTAYVERLAGADSVSVTSGDFTADRRDVHLVCTGVDVLIPLASLVDIEKERERVCREIQRVEGEYRRAESKLANEKFTSKAPAAVVEEERKKLHNAGEMLAKLRERMSDLENC